MRPVLTPAEAAELDRATQARGVTGAALMERAGSAVALTALSITAGAYGRRAVVVCGTGNNGGDGFVAARHLARAGMRVTAVAAVPVTELRGDARANASRLSETAAILRPLSEETLARELIRADVAVDAVFGTGFRGAPEGSIAGAIDAMSEGPAAVLSVDIPSGVDGETGAVPGTAVRADVTVTFGAEKRGTVLLPGGAHAGVVEIADIGFPDDLVPTDTGVVEASDVARSLPVRELDAHKRSSGVVLVVGGSRDMTGAPQLMAEAAYRTGAGLVIVAVPEGILPVVQAGLTEAVYQPLPETASGEVAASALSSLEARFGELDAVAVGPGLGRSDAAGSFVRELVAACPVPVVLDADGLGAFEGRARAIAERRSAVVLTPHAGEFARLAGIGAREVGQDRIGHTQKLAVDARGAVLLKGSRTVVANEDGRVRLVVTGSPALATAGSGDVLTGTVAALLARGGDPAEAASAGAYLHGRAGRLAGRDLGEGTTARDVLARLPLARREVLGVGA